MTSREEILLDSIKEALSLYQRSLVWATTAALSGALIALRLRDPNAPSVQILSGALSAPVAWGIAQILYLVFGSLAYSSIQRGLLALRALNPSKDTLDAIRFFPSLATMPGRFFRLGSALLPLFVTCISWTIELLRERKTSTQSLTFSFWLGVLVIAIVVVLPYYGILTTLRDLRLWSPSDTAKPAGGRSGQQASSPAA